MKDFFKNHSKEYIIYHIKFEIARRFRITRLKIGNYFRFHKITRTLTILFIILSIIYAVKLHMHNKALENLAGDLPVGDYEEYIDTLKDIPSDIEGMSQYDKYSMGLDYRTGSDSDRDGLTDKEEIEVYGTDPLKASTAGDLYTDSYKVQNGMDLSLAYDYNNDREFSLNECKDVILEADLPTDFIATVEDCSDEYSLDNWGIDQVYRGYYLYNFGGKMSIDMNSFIDSEGISSSDISVWVYDGAFLTYGLSELKECKFRETDNVIALDQEFDPEHCYYVFITAKKTLLNSIINTNKTDAIQINNRMSDVHYMIVDCFNNITIYYPEMETEVLEDEFMRNITNKYNAHTASFKASTEDKIQLMYKTYETFVPFMENDFEVKYQPENIWGLIPLIPKVIFSYQLCDYHDDTAIAAGASGSNSDGDNIIYKYNNYHTSFDPNVDELPFQNFASKHSAGNCAGISYLTCALHNTGSIPQSGSYAGIDWDLSEDPANATLMDPGLNDYKTKSFVDEKGTDNYLGDGLSAGEREFVDMIGAYWMQTNDAFDIRSYMIENKDGLSWDVAEIMMDRLDQGKIITASFLMTDGTGHQVVLYDYYWIDDEEMVFRVYDSNIPMNHTDGYTLNCDGACYLQCKKKDNGDGTYNFVYFYYPIEGAANYCATSDVRQNRYSAIIISDETLAVYN